MRIGIFGSRWLGAKALETAKGYGEVVYAAAPSPQDRLAVAAASAGAKLIETNRPGWADEAAQTPVDLIVAAHFERRIPGRVLATSQWAIGYHPSLLPLHRGLGAVEATIRERDRVAGGSVYALTGELDGGPVVVADWCFVVPGETPRQLWERALAPLGVELLDKAIGHLAVYGFLQTDNRLEWGSPLAA